METLTILNEETIIVHPIDEAKLSAYIEQLVWKRDDIAIVAKCPAILDESNVLVNSDCVYNILEKQFFDNQIQHVALIEVREKKLTPEGWTYPLFTSYHFSIGLEKLKSDFGLPCTSLKEYMGSRYNYNPRVSKNMKDLIATINSNL
jgi:hypothetical protein